MSETAGIDLNVNIEGYGDQVDFIQDTHRYAAEVGGIGSGKTLSGADKALLKCTEHPGVGGIVTAPDYNRISDTVIPKYMERFPLEFWAERPRGNPPNARTILGNNIYFRSTTHPNDLRGPTVGWVHMDEAAYSPFEAYKVLQGRIRAIEEAQIWITTSPNKDNPLNWVYGEFAAKQQPTHALFHLNTLENPFIPDAFKEDLLRQYPDDLQLIELQGLFIPLAGNCFFDTAILRSMLELDAREPIETRRNDAIKLFKPVGIGKRYVAGIDTAEGKQAGDVIEGSGNPDLNCLRIQDFGSGEDVAEIHCRWPLDEFLDESVRLMKEFNEAYCGIEINYNRSVANKLIELGYKERKVYSHKDGELGWLTSSLTRMPMLSEYEEAIRSRSLTMYSKDCIMEHLSFIRDKQGRPSAANNAHDDYVIAGGICWQMRKYAKFGDQPGKAYWRRVRIG